MRFILQGVIALICSLVVASNIYWQWGNPYLVSLTTIMGTVFFSTCTEAIFRALANFNADLTVQDAPVAENCATWKNGHCRKCGAPWQDFAIPAEHKCWFFSKRTPDSPDPDTLYQNHTPDSLKLPVKQ